MVQAIDHEAVEGDMDQEAVEGAVDGASDARSDRWYKRWITKRSMYFNCYPPSLEEYLGVVVVD